MKNCKSLILGCVFAVLVLPLVGLSNASAQNLLVTGDFETGDFTGWEMFGESPSSVLSVESPDNGPSLPGSNNAFLNNQAEALALGIKQGTGNGSAGPGTYYYSFDLQLTEAGVGAVIFLEIFAEMEDGGVVGSLLQGPWFPAPGEWITIQGTFEATAANTSFLTMQFAAITGAVQGSVSAYHVDNAYIGVDQPVGVEEESWGGIKALYR